MTAQLSSVKRIEKDREFERTQTRLREVTSELESQRSVVGDLRTSIAALESSLRDEQRTVATSHGRWIDWRLPDDGAGDLVELLPVQGFHRETRQRASVKRRRAIVLHTTGLCTQA